MNNNIKRLTSSLTLTIHLQIGVTDIDDNAPVFSQFSTVLNISEAAELESTWTLPKATDHDSDSNTNTMYTLKHQSQRKFLPSTLSNS